MQLLWVKLTDLKSGRCHLLTFEMSEDMCPGGVTVFLFGIKASFLTTTGAILKQQTCSIGYLLVWPVSGVKTDSDSRFNLQLYMITVFCF